MNMTGRLFVVMAGVGALAYSAQAENVVYLKNGRTLSGKTLEWKEVAQEYVISTGETTMPIPRAQVAKITADKPAEFDQAAGLVKSRLFGQAIPALEAIVKKYRMMNWDVEAGKLLAQAYLETNDPKKAVATMENLFSVVSRDQVAISLQMTYWKALLSSGADAQLRKELDQVIGAGTSEMAAAAYLMRGTMFLKTGEEDAALSDFLKLTTLFQSQKAVQPEALFRAAELLDKARDSRGAELRKKLTQEYPGNEFAVKAAAKPIAAPAPAKKP